MYMYYSAVCVQYGIIIILCNFKDTMIQQINVTHGSDPVKFVITPPDQNENGQSDSSLHNNLDHKDENPSTNEEVKKRDDDEGDNDIESVSKVTNISMETDVTKETMRSKTVNDDTCSSEEEAKPQQILESVQNGEMNEVNSDQSSDNQQTSNEDQHTTTPSNIGNSSSEGEQPTSTANTNGTDEEQPTSIPSTTDNDPISDEQPSSVPSVADNEPVSEEQPTSNSSRPIEPQTSVEDQPTSNSTSSKPIEPQTSVEDQPTSNSTNSKPIEPQTSVEEQPTSDTSKQNVVIPEVHVQPIADHSPNTDKKDIEQESQSDTIGQTSQEIDNVVEVKEATGEEEKRTPSPTIVKSKPLVTSSSGLSTPVEGEIRR